jgi:hypothetical protein
MAGVLEGMKDESGYNSLGILSMDKIGCVEISCKIVKKEGGESQLDVGGKNGHRLSPVHYTSIAEIKGFRFKVRKDLSPPQREISKRKRYQVPGGPAPNPQRPLRRCQSPRE